MRMRGKGQPFRASRLLVDLPGGASVSVSLEVSSHHGDDEVYVMTSGRRREVGQLTFAVINDTLTIRQAPSNIRVSRTGNATAGKGGTANSGYMAVGEVTLQPGPQYRPLQGTSATIRHVPNAKAEVTIVVPPEFPYAAR